MDINCSRIIDGNMDVHEMGKVIFQKILDVVSGHKSKGELLGFGEYEFSPWHLGAIL